VGLKLYGAYQLLLYADYVNLLRDKKNAIKKNKETLTDPSMQVGLEVNAEETKYMLLSRHQNGGKIHNIKRTKGCSDNVILFTYLGMTVRNHFLFQGKIKGKLNSGNAYYRSVQSHLSSRLLSKIVNIWIYKI
jgi:hypothetical protein